MKLELNDVGGGHNLSVINDNFTKIEQELNDKVLYRDNPVGTPNTVEQDLDMDGKQFLNVGAPVSLNSVARLKDIQDIINGGISINTNAKFVAFAPASNISSINVQDAVEEVNSFVGAGVVATNIQDAINEVNTFTQSGVSTKQRLKQDKIRENLSVDDFTGVDPTGVLDSTAGIQAAINAAKGVLEFPGPAYRVDGQLVWKNGIIYKGRGINIFTPGGTKITFNATSTDATKISNPLNSSTPANITFQDLYFYAPSLVAEKAILFDTGSTYVKVQGCRFYSTGDGIILDQSELWDIEHTSFLLASATSVGIWLVNGPDKQVGSNTFYTNRIGVRSCDFNGSSGATCIRDDGGTAHTFENNNYNACGNHIIATSVNGLKIDGGEFEISSAQTIICGLLKRKGGTGSKSPSVSITRTFLYNNINQPVLAMVAGAVGKLEFTNNIINTAFGNPLSGLSVGCDEIVAYGNTQTGIGVGGASINNYIDTAVGLFNWTATTTAPVLGNGSLVATYSRRGKLVTWRLRLTIGSTTTLGTGDWLFQLPFPASTSEISMTGSAALLIAGLSRYSGTARIDPDGLNARICVTNPSLVSGVVPAVWTTNSTLEFQIQYVSVDPI